MGIFFHWPKKEELGMRFRLLTLVVLGCALLLLFFYFSQYPLYAGIGAVIGLVAGSVATMKDERLAKAVFVASVVAIQLVTLGYVGGFPIAFFSLCCLFAILDAVVVWLLLKK
jgi:hypothetical protein